MEEIIRRDGLIIKENIHGITLYKKLYRDSLQKPKTILDKSSYTSTSGVKDLRNILPDSSFTYPKPLQLIKDLIEIGSDENSIILDAFSGSGTTGQAVLELNKNNTSNRSFILIDLDTSITEKRIINTINGCYSNKKENELKENVIFYEIKNNEI